MLFSIVYVSSATTLFSHEQLLELLQRARERNAAHEITGVLLYKDGNFMQLLEGEETVVKSTFARIAQDPRHKGLLVLLKGAVDNRSFPEWSMSFRDLRRAPVGEPGFSEFLNTPLTAEEFLPQPDRARRLLMSFKNNM